jgi:hypothetical protein
MLNLLLLVVGSCLVAFSFDIAQVWYGL